MRLSGIHVGNVSKPRQLTLGVQLNDDASFENFYCSSDERDSNRQIVQALQRQCEGLGEQFIFLWGAAGSGVSHLLQAACHRAGELGKGVQYWPLQELIEVPPQQLLDGMQQMQLVCLDNLDAIAGRPEWEGGVFHLFNQLRDLEIPLLVGANKGPRELGVTLPDLQSRLQFGLVFQVASLGDDAKIAALQHRAAIRGMQLSDDVAAYILHRMPRDSAQLFSVLDQLDEQSLAAKRRLTVPFVKQILGL